MKRKCTPGTCLFAVLTAIVVVVFVCFPSATAEAVYPLERAAGWFSRTVLTRLSGLWAGVEASAECVRLRREVAELAVWRGECARLKAENARLRQAAGFAAQKAADWLPATVLAADGRSAFLRRVDRGSGAGVKVGAVVCTGDGLVGIVESVTPHTSLVRLVLDPSVMVSCEIKGGASVCASGILAGGNEEQLELRHLSARGRFSSRDAVVTSGRGGVFPKGIAVGTVLKAQRDADGRVNEVEVAPAVDFGELKEVFIRREK